jgi:hypothetical protein
LEKLIKKRADRRFNEKLCVSSFQRTERSCSVCDLKGLGCRYSQVENENLLSETLAMEVNRTYSQFTQDYLKQVEKSLEW